MFPSSSINIPLAPTDAPNSSVHVILERLPLPANPVTVDVGAGGFVGTTTTEPILDTVGGRVICIEADQQRSEALGKKFGARITNICGYYGTVGANTQHDLVVLDLDSGAIPLIFEKLLNFALTDGLKPGGFLISLIVYNIDVAYDGTPGFPHPDAKKAQSDFVQRYFGSQIIDASVLERKFQRDLNFEFIALVDKEMGRGRNCIGWVVLRRRLKLADRLRNTLALMLRNPKMEASVRLRRLWHRRPRTGVVVRLRNLWRRRPRTGAVVRLRDLWRRLRAR